MVDSERNQEKERTDSTQVAKGNLEDELLKRHKRTRDEAAADAQDQISKEGSSEQSKDVINQSSDGKNSPKKMKLEDENGKSINGSTKSNVKTPAEEKNEKETAAKKSSADSDGKPKFVFGSGTTFGTGFGAVKSISPDDKDATKAENVSKPFAFGSGLSFGSGFGILKKNDETSTDKKEVADDKDKEETPKVTPSEIKIASSESQASPVPASQKTTVKLQKQEVKSGEEAEETIYQVNAKLYQLSALKDGWKERGVGIVRVNKHSDANKARLVMRSRGILKVILNLPLIKGIKIHKGFPGSLQSEKFIRIISVDDNKAPVQYAIKTGKQETVSELYDNIVTLVPQ